jgi:hypothetical protein
MKEYMHREATFELIILYHSPEYPEDLFLSYINLVYDDRKFLKWYCEWKGVFASSETVQEFAFKEEMGVLGGFQENEGGVALLR